MHVPNSGGRIVAIAMMIFSIAFLISTSAFAYQADDGGGEKAAATDGGEAPAADAGGDAAASEATAGGGATEEAAAPAAPESFLEYLWKSNGWIFGPAFLVMSVVLIAMLLINIMQVRRDNFLPASFVEDFEEKLTGKDYQGAYEIARTDESFLAKVLAAGLAKLNRGYSEAVEGMQEAGEEENMAVEHRLSYLALIGTIAPMLGLLGTVWGMVAAFQVIAHSATQPKPSELAGGISMALMTTLEGLILAIPALIAYSLLRNRAARFVLEVGMVSEGLMHRFSSLGRSKTGASNEA